MCFMAIDELDEVNSNFRDEVCMMFLKNYMRILKNLVLKIILLKRK